MSKELKVTVAWDKKYGEATVSSTHDDKRAIYQAANAGVSAAIANAFKPKPPVKPDKAKAKPVPVKKAEAPKAAKPSMMETLRGRKKEE